MKKALFIAVISLAGIAAWFGDVEKQDDPHPNLLSGLNPGLENSTSKWVASTPAHLTASTANPALGVAHGEWDAAATSDTLRSADVVIPKGLEGRACLVEVEYWLVGGAAGDVVMRMETDGGDALTTDLSLAVNGKYVKAQLGFICPTADSIRLEFEATANASALRFDASYIGRDFRLGTSASSGLVAVGNYPPTGGCFPSTTSTTYATPTDVSCPVMTVSYSSVAVNTADDDIFDIVFDNLPAGKYEVTASVTVNLLGASSVGGAVLYDGTTRVGEQIFGLTNPGNIFYPVTLTGIFDHAGGAVTYTIQTKVSASTIYLINDSNFSADGVDFSVKKIAESVDDTVTLETQGWYVDGFYLGNNPDLGTANNATYAEVSENSMTMTINPGSADADTPCQAPAVSTGKTCAAKETIGLVTDIPYAGTYEACFGFSHYVDLDTVNDDMDQLFKISETSNISITEISGGTSVRASKWQLITTALRLRQSNNLHICQIFNFSSAGQKTIRLMERSSVSSGAVLVNFINANNTSTSSISFKMYPLTQNFPQAVALTNTPTFYKKSVLRVDDLISPVGSCTTTATTLEFCCDTATNNSFAWVLPYKVGDDWFLKFSAMCDSTGNNFNFDFAIAGIEFNSHVTDSGQAVTVGCDALTDGTTPGVASGVAVSGNNKINGICTTSVDNFFYSGDVWLSGKPAWLNENTGEITQ